MTLSELRTLARQRLDDQRAEKYLWDNTELNSYINQAINEAAIRSRSILDSTTGSCCAINVIAGKSVYPLHPSVFQIKRVFDNTNKTTINKTGFDELDERVIDWQSQTGNPTHYIDDMNHYGDDDVKKHSITLFPVPTAPLTLKLTVFRTPLYALTETDEPELPSFQHADLIYWACYLAYTKHESVVNDAQKAAEMEKKFIESFGQKQDARKLEWRRKYRPIRTVGQFF